MYIPKFFKNILPLAIALSVLAACTKEEPVVIEETIEVADASSAVKALMEMEDAKSITDNYCFDFVYPVELIVEDEKLQAVESFEELNAIFKSWYEENKGKENNAPALNYPLEVSVSDGTIKEIQNDKALITLILSCKVEFDDKDKDKLNNNCFEIKYPVTLIFDDQSTIVVNTGEEHKVALEDKGKGKPNYEFPIEVIFEEEKTLEVKSQEDLDKLYKECKEKWHEEDKDGDDKLFDLTYGYSDCFKIIYPVTLMLGDNTTRTINDKEDLEDLTNWIRSDEFQKFTFQFPLSITLLKDNTTKVIVSTDAWYDLTNSCHENWNEDDWDDKDNWGDLDSDEDDQFTTLFSDCFEVNYPITLILEDGNTKVVNSEEEVEELIRTTGREGFKFQFPVSITFEDEKKEIASIEELVKLLVEKCFNDWGDDWDYEEDDEEWDHSWHDTDWERDIELLGVFSDCFQINYPLTIILADGTTQVVNSIDDMAEAVRSANRQAFTFQFPINITVEDDELKEINSLEELDEVLKTCLNSWQNNHHDWEDIWDFGDDFDWEIDFEDFSFFEDCFKINYPISVYFEERGELTINNDEEFKRIIATVLKDAFNGDQFGSSEINYPLSVTLRNGTTQTLNSDEELWKMIEDCG